MSVQSFFRRRKTDRELSQSNTIIQDVKEREKISHYDDFELAIWTIDIPKDEITFVSSGISLITGYSLNDFLHQKTQAWEAIVFPEDLPIFKKLMETKKRTKGKYRIVHKNGEIKYLKAEIRTHVSDKGEVIQLDGILTDITEYEALNEMIHVLQNHDKVTDLSNRNMFEEQLNSLIRKSKGKLKFALMSIDIDGFSLINDTLGYETGNLLLKKVAERLTKNLRREDFVSRIGNDEFTVLVKNYLNEREAIAIAKRIVEVLEAPYRIGQEEIYCTVSVGISFYPEDGRNADTLFKNAEIAMKDRTFIEKNRYKLFTSDMDIQAYKKFTLGRDLRRAFHHREFYMVYQPRVNVKTGRVIGAEALIRWNHPNWQEVSPGEFMPLIEENNMMYDMTIWILKTVCQQLNEWSRNNFSVLPVSINISPTVFSNPRWVENLKAIMLEMKVDPTLIELEIIETQAVQEEEVFLHSINKIKEMGLQISLDDFGVGYSSMHFLKNDHINIIKIDRKFVQDTTENGQFLMRSMIQVVRQLGKEVVAEGVETSEQLNFVRQQECEYVQGFLLSRPLDPDKYEKFLLNPEISFNTSSKSEYENRRKGFRLPFTHPLVGTMTIVSYQGKEVKMGKTSVLIEDIGIGGIRFTSNINLPVSPDIILEFETEILNEKLQLPGNIVWKETTGEFLQYGIQFALSEIEQNKFVKLLNQLEIKMRKNPIPNGCSFYLESKKLFLTK